MPTRRAWITVASLLLFISACGESDKGTTVLRVANWGGPAVDPSFLRLEREIREGFERRHPGVRVQMEHIPGPGQYEPKLLMMFVSGHAPDVIHLDASSAAVFIDHNVLADLTPQINEDPEFKPATYFKNVFDIARRGNAVYAIPLDFTPMVMVYNKQLFDLARVPYPQEGWTWQDFLERCRRLTETKPGTDKPARYGFNFVNWMPGWVPWIWLNGADVLSPDGRHAVGYFDAPESIEAIQFLVDLIVKHRVAPNLTESTAAGVDLFRAGRAAMHLTGHWSLIEYRADGMDIGIVGLPTNTQRPETVMYESGLAITRTSSHAELAWEYITYMTGEAVQRRRVSTGLAISAHQAVAQEYADTEVERAFLSAVAYARPPWGARVARYPFCEDLGREMFDDILHGGVPVADAMHRTAALIEAEVAQP
ncbi:MAG: sugar ABC transporter substrate-binding protein [Planctomycetes bacterium]|nr:sugar ABC transporter substrate-binding protein [Planctomycetota bacterium]